MGRLREALEEAAALPLMEALRRGVVESNRYPSDQLPALRTRMTLITCSAALQAHSALRYAEWRGVVAEWAAARLGDDLVPRVIGHAAPDKRHYVEPRSALRSLKTVDFLVHDGTDQVLPSSSPTLGPRSDASWAAVVQARRSSEDARRDAAESSLPVLLVSRSVTTPGVGSATFGLSVYNAGGGVAANAAVLLVVDGLFGRHLIDFLRPGETVSFGSTVVATGKLDNSRAFAYAETQNGRQLAWDDRGVRREFENGLAEMPLWDQVYNPFSPRDTLRRRKPVELLRGDVGPLWPVV